MLIYVEYASFYFFTTFTSEVKLLWHMYKYFLKHPFRQNIFKQRYRNVVFRYHIFTLALYTYSTYASLNTGGFKACMFSCMVRYASKALSSSTNKLIYHVQIQRDAIRWERLENWHFSRDCNFRANDFILILRTFPSSYSCLATVISCS